MTDSGAPKAAIQARMLVKTPKIVDLYDSRCRRTRKKSRVEGTPEAPTAGD